MPSQKPHHSWLNGTETYILPLHNRPAWQGQLREALGQAQTYQDTLPSFTKWNLKAGAQRLKLHPVGRGVSWALKPPPISYLTASPQHHRLYIQCVHSLLDFAVTNWQLCLICNSPRSRTNSCFSKLPDNLCCIDGWTSSQQRLFYFSLTAWNKGLSRQPHAFLTRTCMTKLAPQNRLSRYGADLVEVPFLSSLVNSIDESVSACLFLTSVTLIRISLSLKSFYK